MVERGGVWLPLPLMSMYYLKQLRTNVAMRSYATVFPLSENPISEGGAWRHYDPTLTVVKTEVLNSTHVAHGTQAGGAFDDSSACLDGFSENHRIRARVWISPTIVSAGNKEIECLLRWQDNPPPHTSSFGDTSIRGYEINVQHEGAYLQLGVFKGALLASAVSPPVPVTGDLFEAEIRQVGANAHIQVWWNSVLQIDFTDTSPVRGGNPGMGFFIDPGAGNDQFGMSGFTAMDLAA